MGAFRLACSSCSEPYPAAGLPAACPRCGGLWGARPIAERLAGWRPTGTVGGLAAQATCLGLTGSELSNHALGQAPRELEGTLLLQQGSTAPPDNGPGPGDTGPAGRPPTPGGSYKERGAMTLAAACQRRGIREVFLDSSGNAGLAIAAACSARGIHCRVLVPSTTPRHKRAAIEAAGGRLTVVDGDRAATFRAAQTLRRELPYASHIFQPSFLLGVASLVWEAWSELGGSLPDHWLLPVGHGALILGVVLGLDTLAAADLLPRRPTLWPVQLAGYAALAEPERRGVRAAPPRAAGIAIDDPPRLSELRTCLSRDGGSLVVVDEAEVATSRRRLAQVGIGTDPTGAAAWAAFERLRREGRAGDGASWAIILTSREPSP